MALCLSVQFFWPTLYISVNFKHNTVGENFQTTKFKILNFVMVYVISSESNSQIYNKIVNLNTTEFCFVSIKLFRLS